MIHECVIRDMDHHFVVDPITRAVTNAESKKNKLMQRDHNSECFTFEIDREIEGHDMSDCNVVRIHYNNIESGGTNMTKGLYEVKDLTINQNDSAKVIFSWTITEEATQYPGPLSFIIEFKCVDEKGKVTYRWCSDINGSISVYAGINNDDYIAEEYADILEQWKAEIDEALTNGTGGSSHEHENKNTLDGFYCEAVEYVPPEGDLPVVGGGTVKSDRLEYQNQQIRYCVDGQVITQVEEFDNEIILTLAEGANLSGELYTSQIVIPLGVSQSEMETYVTAAINGTLDEIEAMIDESGVLDE